MSVFQAHSVTDSNIKARTAVYGVFENRIFA